MVAQLEEVWTVNHAVDRSTSSSVNLNKKAFSKHLILKLLGLSDRGLNLEASCTTIIPWAR